MDGDHLAPSILSIFRYIQHYSHNIYTLVMQWLLGVEMLLVIIVMGLMVVRKMKAVMIVVTRENMG